MTWRPIGRPDDPGRKCPGDGPQEKSARGQTQSIYATRLGRTSTAPGIGAGCEWLELRSSLGTDAVPIPADHPTKFADLQHSCDLIA